VVCAHRDDVDAGDDRIVGRHAALARDASGEIVLRRDLVDARGRED